MSNADQSAFPVYANHPTCGPQTEWGLTKREYFAVAAMQGALAGVTSIIGPLGPVNVEEERIALGAIRCADALLAALEKQL